VRRRNARMTMTAAAARSGSGRICDAARASERF
jgi:hypothetical protein